MYWKGKKRSEATKLKISRNNGSYWLGKTMPPEIRAKLGHKGHPFYKGGEKGWFKKGRENLNYVDGTYKNPYPKEFTASLKLKVRVRDNYTCCLCGRTEREELEEFNRVLCVNHIDFIKENCRLENLNTLCLRCNVRINRDRDYWSNYFNGL